MSIPKAPSTVGMNLSPEAETMYREIQAAYRGIGWDKYGMAYSVRKRDLNTAEELVALGLIVLKPQSSRLRPFTAEWK